VLKSNINNEFKPYKNHIIQNWAISELVGHHFKETKNNIIENILG